MDQKDKDTHAVSDHGYGEESCKKEKMKKSPSGSCKAEAESMAGEKIAAKSPTPTPRKCDLCGKIFNSGKALGGHRRSHFLKNQKKVKVRSTNHSSKGGDSSNNRANCDYDDDDGKHICCICKKEFPSKNALFGHMRSHPERSWRGVSPPHSHQHSSSSLSLSFSYSSSQNSDSMEKNMENHDDDDNCVGGEDGLIVPDEHHREVIDLSKFTSPSWLKTDKRGRKCIGAYEAAETLAYLSAYSKYFYGESNRVCPKNDEVLLKSAPPLVKQQKRKIVELSSSKKQEVKKIKFCFKGELKLGNENDGAAECGDKVDKLNRYKGLSESGVERVSYDGVEKGDMEGFNDVNAEAVAPARVQDLVDKRKVKKMDQKGKSNKKLALKSKINDTGYENGGQEKVSGYKCGACGKVFSTFQGLGGHRSVHKEKNTVTMDESNHSEAVAEENNSSSSSNMHKMDEATVNEVPLPAHEAYQSSGTKKFDFDLNELPCAMED